MAETLGDLKVRLGFDGSEFNRGIFSSIKPIQWLEDKITSANAKFAAFTALVTGGAISVGFGELARQMGDQIQKLGNLSDTLGLGVEALNAFDLGAKKANVNFEALTGGIAFFEKTLARAAAGDEGMQRLFSGIGLDADVLSALPPIDAIKRTTDAINGLDKATDRVLMTSVLFGRNAARELRPFLREGSEGIDEMIQRSNELGGAFSRVDSQMINNASAAVSELTAQFKNFAGVFAVELSPLVEAVINKFIDWGMEGPKAIDLINWGLEKLATSIGYVGDAWQVVDIVWSNVALGILKTIDLIREGVAKLYETIQSAAKNIPGMKSLFPDKDFNSFVEKMDKPIADLQAHLKDLMESPWKHNAWPQAIRDIREQARRTAEDQVAGNEVVGASLDDLFEKKDKMARLDDKFSVKQVGLFDAMNYLRNVARGTQINGAMVSGPADAGRVQEVSDPQLSETNKYLAQIMDNTEYSYAVAG